MDIRSLFGISLRVLVVDREEALGDLVRNLENFHYDVIACTEAASALNVLKLAKQRIDLIVTEVKIPKLDGFSFLNIVKELNIPVIMMSCSPHYELAIKCFAAGATFYYQKPIDMENVSGLWRHIPLSRIFASSMRVRTIKEQKSHEEALITDSLENEADAERRKVTWTDEMHLEFIHAVDILGVTKASPVKLLKLMDRKGLGNKQVASHLQRYRDHLKGKYRDKYKRKVLWSGDTMFEKPSIFDSGPTEMIDRHKAELCMEQNPEDPNINAKEEDGSLTQPEAFRDNKKRKKEDTQKSIKLPVWDTVQEKSTRIDSRPEDMGTNNVYERSMLDNETNQSTSVAPTDEAVTQMYCDQKIDNNSEGHKSTQESIEVTTLENPFVPDVDTEDMVNPEIVKMLGLENELAPTISVPEAGVSENQFGETNNTGTRFDQQTAMSEYNSEFETMMLDAGKQGNIEEYSLTLENLDSNLVESFSGYTDLMLFDSVEKIMWTGQGTEVMDEHTLLQNLTRGNSHVSLECLNGTEPDDKIHSMPEPTTSVNVNEQEALQEIENLPIFSDNEANNQYDNTSGANEENLGSPGEMLLDPLWRH